MCVCGHEGPGGVGRRCPGSQQGTEGGGGTDEGEWWTGARVAAMQLMGPGGPGAAGNFGALHCGIKMHADAGPI